jgi:hypothetical protein
MSIASSQFVAWGLAGSPNLTSGENQIINMVDGTHAYYCDVELESMTLNNTISGYSFRSSGSTGATAIAEWIQNQFEGFGLETHAEAFQFTTWNVMTHPILTIDLDGNPNTTDDQVAIDSFQPEHYSWPTPENGVFAQIVTLPLPEISSHADVQLARYDAQTWLAVNTTGKILLVGREIQMMGSTMQAFINKLQTQPPAVLIYTGWYSWSSWVPQVFSSASGYPASEFGPYLWNLRLPTGEIGFRDGRWIRDALANDTNISAQVIINASITQGPHYNVVGKLRGSTNPDRMIVISAHYDSTMTPAFCDDGAGVAGVLELAKIFSDANRTGEYRPPYTLVFVTFAGEELGSVGSIDYVRQHADEMRNVAAVLNIDCIGSRTIQITETTTDDSGLDLQDIVTEAASDLNAYVDCTYSGVSDQETFRNPVGINENYRYIWNSDAGIANATRVKSSIRISSIPALYSDIWTDIGASGWVHTPYDNSTSTRTFDWVRVDSLRTHIQVVGLSVMRVPSAATNQFPTEIGISVTVAGAAAAIMIYVERTRFRILLKNIGHEISVNFGTKEVVFVIFLTGVYILLSLVSFMRIGRDEMMMYGFSRITTFRYYGKPFEMIAVLTSTAPINDPGHGPGELELTKSPEYTGSTFVLFQGLLLDLVLYSLLALLTVYVVLKLRYLWEYHHYSNVQRQL